MSSKIHHTAIVAPEAKIGIGVEIGPFSIVHSNVELGDQVKVGAYCELGVPTPLGSGAPLIIGADSMIRSHSVFYQSSTLGSHLVTGHRVTVRENSKAGVSFQIGSATEIQGDCIIGDYVRFQSNVFVGKNTRVGNFVWVLPYVVLTNDPTPPSNVLVGCVIEDYAVLSACCLVLPGVTVGSHAVVAAKACVTRNVAPNMLVAGVPARVKGEANLVSLRDGSGRSAYPWTRHFTRGYPDNVVLQWSADGSDVPPEISHVKV